jgi:hypothetical protein
MAFLVFRPCSLKVNLIAPNARIYYLYTAPENPIYVFPEKKLRSLVPYSYTHVSVSDLSNSRIGLTILLQQIGRPILGIYKLLTDTEHECGNWERGHTVSYLEYINRILGAALQCEMKG